ncbi:MAG: manganese efflux pump [Clostridia bacterium]|nr:manganese efflux pump [Clostridia bacterium]
MGFFGVLLTGVALSMDACAVGMTNGMCDTKMPLKRTLLIALFFGVFQMLMPLIGYFITGIMTDAFQETFEKISSWISFALLAFLGGKMIVDGIKEWRAASAPACDVEEYRSGETLSVVKLLLQAIATSIDALAIGVVMQLEGLVMGVWLSTALIGVTTFGLVIAAVYIGKIIGNKLADKATLLGGVVLVAIGVKILIESLL